jgi:hypothetical protein
MTGFEAFSKLLQEPLRGPMMKHYLQQAHGRLCEKMDKLVRMPLLPPVVVNHPNIFRNIFLTDCA